MHSILGYVFRHGTARRYEISEVLGLSQSAVVEYTRTLIDEGYLEESGHDASSGGRPAVRLQFNPDYRHAVTIVVDVDNIRGTVIDVIGNVHLEAEVAVPKNPGRESLVAAIVELAETLIRRRGTGPPLLGIGLALGGFVDSRKGISREYLHAIDWYDVPLAKIVSERFGLPCIVENKARALTLGEMHYGAGTSAENMICLWLGQGIGMGVTLGGRLHDGATGSAGEFGHIQVVESGEMCFCGKRGCLETVASEGVLLSKVRESLAANVRSELHRIVGEHKTPLTMGLVVEACNRGDSLVRAVFKEAAAYVGKELAKICNVLNPELLVLEGSVTYGNEYFCSEVRRHVEENALPQIAMSLRVESYEAEENRRMEGLVTRLLLEHLDELAQ